MKSTFFDSHQNGVLCSLRGGEHTGNRQRQHRLINVLVSLDYVFVCMFTSLLRNLLSLSLSLSLPLSLFSFLSGAAIEISSIMVEIIPCVSSSDSLLDLFNFCRILAI